MAFLLYSDFSSGKYRISQTTDTQTALTAYITKFEKKYLRLLLGATLYTQFMASLQSNVPTGVYLTIYNEFAEDNDNSGFVFQRLDGAIFPSVESGAEAEPVVISEGIKEMLKGFIYFEFVKDQQSQNTPNGNVQKDNENAINLSQNQANIKEKYNIALDTFNAIQWYINEHSEDYPDYNGVKLDKIPFIS